MDAERPLRLSQEIALAGRGLWRLLRFDPRWPEPFDLTTGGFLRSFFGPALALPVFLIGEALIAQAAQEAVGAFSLTGAAAAYLFEALGFPLLIYLLARPLRMGDGYAAFVVVTNWAVLFLTLITSAAAFLVLLGAPGVSAFGLVALAAFCAQVFIIWRAARESLSHELAPVLLVVVLWVAVDTFADRLAAWVFGG